MSRYYRSAAKGYESDEKCILVNELIDPYDDILCQIDVIFDAYTPDGENTPPYKSVEVSGFLMSEGEVVFNMLVDDEMIELSLVENTYLHGDDSAPEEKTLLEMSWSIADPESIPKFHRALREFIDTLYQDIIKNIGTRLKRYKAVREGNKKCLINL